MPRYIKILGISIYLLTCLLVIARLISFNRFESQSMVEINASEYEKLYIDGKVKKIISSNEYLQVKDKNGKVYRVKKEYTRLNKNQLKEIIKKVGIKDIEESCNEIFILDKNLKGYFASKKDYYDALK